MNSPEPLDPIDSLLRDVASDVEDEGFTARVRAKLRPRRRVPRRVIIFGLATVASSFAMMQWRPWESLPPLHLASILSPNPAELMPWMISAVVATCLGWVAIDGLQSEE